MIRQLFGLAVILWMFSTAGGAEETATAQAGAKESAQGSGLAEPLSDLQEYLDAITSLEAEFEQVMFDADNNIKQISTGHFRLLKPGKFRWDYEQPYQQTIVADGERLWIYDADLEQVTVRRMDDSLATTPASLLSGAGAIADSYALRNQFNADDFDWTELQPRSRDTDFGLVRLGFGDGELRVMDLVDSLGQTTRIHFSAIDHNPGLLPAVFSFVPPPGADVIGEDDF